MDLAGREDLMNAVALNSMLFNVARVVGPAISGFLMRWLAPDACFFANGLSYIAVLWALARMDITGSSHAAQKSSGLRGLVEGLTYLAGRRELAFLMLLVAITSLCGWPSQTLLPALASGVLKSNEIGYSWMLSGTGIGALTAAWTLATFGSVEERHQLIRAGIGCVSTGLIACPSHQPPVSHGMLRSDWFRADSISRDQPEYHPVELRRTQPRPRHGDLGDDTKRYRTARLLSRGSRRGSLGCTARAPIAGLELCRGCLGIVDRFLACQTAALLP